MVMAARNSIWNLQQVDDNLKWPLLTLCHSWLTPLLSSRCSSFPCYSAFLLCDKIPKGNQFLRGKVHWSSEFEGFQLWSGPVWCLATWWRGTAEWSCLPHGAQEGGDEREVKREIELQYTDQENMPSDLLPLSNPRFPKFPSPSSLVPRAGLCIGLGGHFRSKPSYLLSFLLRSSHLFILPLLLA